MNSIQIRLSDRQMRELDFVVREENRTRTDVIRDAIKNYVSRRSSENGADPFGIWKEKGIDALEYQRKARSEW